MFAAGAAYLAAGAGAFLGPVGAREGAGAFLALLSVGFSGAYLNVFASGATFVLAFLAGVLISAVIADPGRLGSFGVIGSASVSRVFWSKCVCSGSSTFLNMKRLDLIARLSYSSRGRVVLSNSWCFNCYALASLLTSLKYMPLRIWNLT